MTRINYVSLSKSMSKALRHKPERLGIELASDGSVDLRTFVRALNERGGWPRKITEDDIWEVVKHGSKQRFAIENGRIRARYGHSIPQEVRLDQATPPAILYHGTNTTAAISILAQGLLPMGRQFVHLSTDVQTAEQVGRRHGGKLAIFEVDTTTAIRQGVEFFAGNDTTWLAHSIPADCLRIRN